MKKKISIFIALFSLFMTLSLIQSTYAKYSTSTNADNTLAIARWNIKINNQDVVRNSNFSTLIEPVIDTNQYIKEGVIAPTTTGYFDLVIDTTDTDVSFDYSVSLTPSSDSTVTDLKIYKYTINGTEFSGNASSIEGSLLYTNAERFIRLRLFFEWEDGKTGETMDNADDVAATVNGVAKYKLNLNFIQKKDSSN